MKQASVTLTSQNKKKSAHIVLQGDLVVGSLQTVKQELAAAVSRYTTLHIAVKNVIAIDLTGIQVLFALKKSADVLHKRITFDIQLPDEMNTMLSQAGFHDLQAMLQLVSPEFAEK